MIRICLPQEEVARLDQLYRQETDPKTRDRLQIIRLAQRGRAHQDIALDLAISPRTVQRWLNAYLDHGVQGLRRRKAKGRSAAIPAAMSEEIRRWVIQGPQAQGLDRANWTQEELAEHLYKTHGLRASRAAMGRFCRKIGIRLYRPSYRYLRGDPVKQVQAQQDIGELKKKRPRAS